MAAATILCGPATFAASPTAQLSEPIDAVPLGNPGEWVTPDDFPADALASGTTGVVHFEMEVAPTGLPKTCKVTASSGSNLLDEATCKFLMQRAKFKPFQDGRASAVVSVFRSSVKWLIPGEPTPVDGAWSYSFLVAPDGSISDCRMETIAGPPQPDGKDGPVPCPPHKFSPLQDHDGQPPRRIRVRMTTTTEITRE